MSRAIIFFNPPHVSASLTADSPRHRNHFLFRQTPVGAGRWRRSAANESRAHLQVSNSGIVELDFIECVP